MNDTDRGDLRRLELRLFGDDGNGGAFGQMRDDMKPAIEFYQRASGVLAFLRFIGLPGILIAVVALAAAAAGVHLG